MTIKQRISDLLSQLAELLLKLKTMIPPSLDPVIKACIQVESEGDDNAEGDKGLPNHAYGCLQVRQPAVDDVKSQIVGLQIASQCLGNRPLSIKIFIAYMNRYATPQRIGRAVTNEDRARIWNAGPMGYVKDGSPRDKAAAAYWEKVEKYLHT